MQITNITNVKPSLKAGATVATCSVSVNGMTIRGVRILQNDRGYWTNMPTYTINKEDGTKAYIPYVTIEDKEEQQDFKNQVVREFLKWQSELFLEEA